MKTFRYFFLTILIASAGLANGQDLSLLGAMQLDSAAAKKPSAYLFDEYYTGSVTGEGGLVVDGVNLRFNTASNRLEIKKEDSLFVTGAAVTGFTLPTGTALYYFQRGFPAVDNGSAETFYQVLYDGNVKLLKRYSPQKAGTNIIDNGKLYILKAGKMNPVSLSNRESFLKVLSDERNKMNYIIKESQFDFAEADDLVILLQEYDAYKAGRGGN
ncbi:hypothetical protein [Dyadobacter tibetensis]|uniref:hypothetical protein n=1 Tax=Dyadobacter tibetensis TaxID=1211851 RepID=UPI0004726FC4|nr:hypothetical protein [Dyadobacter tibetensis]